MMTKSEVNTKRTKLKKQIQKTIKMKNWKIKTIRKPSNQNNKEKPNEKHETAEYHQKT